MYIQSGRTDNMLNYFNSQKKDGQYLITNDMGFYKYLEPEVYDKLCHDQIKNNDSEYQDLVEKGFIIDTSVEEFVQRYSYFSRSMKAYCLSGTSLHIFAVTNMCNLDCIYCQAHSKSSHLDGKMTKETGKRAIDIAMSSKNNFLTFEFQGGEPLLNFETVKYMIEYSKLKNQSMHKQIEYTIVTNLTQLTDDILNYLLDNNVSICTSLDGDIETHNYNRPYRHLHSGSYDDVIAKIKYLKSKGLQIGVIQTTSKKSIPNAKKIIDQYLELEIHHIFLRPLTPLGMADDSWKDVGYTVEEYIQFYKDAFNYILELNKKGIFFVETHATYFLCKILNNYSQNYMELRSPCGAGLGQMSYYYDGNVFTCDEGRMLHEMGDDSFLIGNVYDNNYMNMISSDICKTLCKASIIECLPKCNNCVYQPYCGTCPVVNYASEHDLYSKNPKDFRCKSYSAIMDILFDIIHRNDAEEMQILYSWIS